MANKLKWGVNGPVFTTVAGGHLYMAVVSETRTRVFRFAGRMNVIVAQCNSAASVDWVEERVVRDAQRFGSVPLPTDCAA